MKMQEKSSKAARGGDTSRTSSQGRKLSSGGNPDKRGNKEKEEVGRGGRKIRNKK